MAQILVFGDSITDGSSDSRGGWADRLKQYFWRKNIKGDIVNNEYYWLYNLGISGNMTPDVLKRIKVESIARKVERRAKGVVFIFAIGINDSALEGEGNPKPRLVEEEFAKNYETLVSFAKQYTNKILCVGLTPVDEAKTNPIYNVLWYNNDRIKSFNSVIKKVAAKNKVGFIELHRPFIKQQDSKNLLIDGLHPNNKGHKWMYEYIKPHVLNLLGS